MRRASSPCTWNGSLEAEAALRQAARAAPLTRAGIAELANRLRAGAHDLSAAIEGADELAAVALMLAGALVGHPPSADQVGRVIARMPHVEALPILVGSATGDRVGMLIDMAASGRLGHERTSLALHLAVELVGDAPPPPRLLTQLRLHAREPLTPEAGVALGVAASGDRRWCAVGGRTLDRACVDEWRRTAPDRDAATPRGSRLGGPART